MTAIVQTRPRNAPRGRLWIVLGGLTVPIVAFILLFVIAMKTLVAQPMMHDPSQPDIRLIAHEWWWEVEYPGASEVIRTANEVHLPVGRPMRVEVISRDVTHSFWVPKLHRRVDLVPGTVSALEFSAGESGFYRGECARDCSGPHAEMQFAVIAESQEAFQRWLDAQRGKAALPVNDLTLRGADVFQEQQCSRCHAVRGTVARGRIGPDLTHLASRPAIAADAFPNSAETLATWIMHAQRLTPGAPLPALPALSPSDELALIGYLQSLR